MARYLTVMQLHLSAGCETVFVANLFVSIDLCAIGGQTNFCTDCWLLLGVCHNLLAINIKKL